MTNHFENMFWNLLYGLVEVFQVSEPFHYDTSYIYNLQSAFWATLSIVSIGNAAFSHFIFVSR